MSKTNDLVKRLTDELNHATHSLRSANDLLEEAQATLNNLFRSRTGLIETMLSAAEKIKNCDYTMARSDLLVAAKEDISLPLWESSEESPKKVLHKKYREWDLVVTRNPKYSSHRYEWTITKDGVQHVDPTSWQNCESAETAGMEAVDCLMGVEIYPDESPSI